MKKAKSGKHYFESFIQTEQDNVKLVGFSSFKRLKIKEFEQNSTAIKIKDARFQIESTGARTFFLSDSLPIHGTVVDFAPQMIEYQDIAISNLSDYSSGDNSLRIKAQVVKVSPPQTSSYNGLQFQDIFVAQGSHKIQLTLCNELVSQVTVNQSILVTNVKIRLTHPPHITTTPNTEISTIDEVAVNSSTLIDDELLETCISGKIISIISVNIFIKCPTCQSPIYDSSPFSELINCQNGKSTSLKETCTQDAMIKFNLKEDISNDIISMTAYADKLKDIVPNIFKANQDDTKIALLRTGKVQVTMKKLSQNVSNIQLL